MREKSMPKDETPQKEHHITTQHATLDCKHKNRQIVQAEIPKERASVTEKNLQKTKSTKINNLAKKTIK